MTEELGSVLNQYELMIRGVLKSGHVYRQNDNFEDYRQELRLLLLKRLLAGEQLTPQDNPMLFKWLLWRLRDLQRGSQRYESRHIFAAEIPEIVTSELAFEQIETVVTIDKLIKKQRQYHVLHDLMMDFMHYPDDLITQRCMRLKIHRMTYHRRLKLLQQIIKQNRTA